MSDLKDKYQAGKWYPGYRSRNERAIKSMFEIREYLKAHEKNQRENRINKIIDSQ